MNQQLRLPVTHDIDVRKFVDFHPNQQPSLVTIPGLQGRRWGEIGKTVGTICLRHSNGYEVLVEFQDGKIESFSPHGLIPVQESESA